jgi:hypothetical protein
MLVAPVAIAYDPVYKKVRQGDGSVKEYKFRINRTRADGSGGLHLDADTIAKSSMARSQTGTIRPSRL